mmetsp:Transcript_16733/g.28515  ORF Transcript_16733/g.28515 Transcript_16733/m.28515 type:complete len:280 (+) Transcript_16733:1242-2081(+)
MRGLVFARYQKRSFNFSSMPVCCTRPMASTHSNLWVSPSFPALVSRSQLKRGRMLRLLILSLKWRSGTSPTQSIQSQRPKHRKECRLRRWVLWTPCTTSNTNTNTKTRRRYHRRRPCRPCSPCSRALPRTNIPTTSRASMPSMPAHRNPMQHNSCISIRCKRQIAHPLNRLNNQRPPVVRGKMRRKTATRPQVVLRLQMQKPKVTRRQKVQRMALRTPRSPRVRQRPRPEYERNPSKSLQLTKAPSVSSSFYPWIPCSIGRKIQTAKKTSTAITRSMER